MEKDKNINIYIFIFLIGLLLRTIKLVIDPLLMRDSVLYLNMVDIWEETGQYHNAITEGAIRPPLMLYSIKYLMKYGFSSEIAGRSLSLFLGSMIPVLGFCIGSMVFKNRQSAFISAIAFLFHPTLIEYSIQPLRENYYLFFVGLVIIAFIKGIRKNRNWIWLICGMLLGLAVNSRYEALELFILIPTSMIFLLHRRKISGINIFKRVAVFFAGCIASCLIMLTLMDFDVSAIVYLIHYKDKIVHEYDYKDSIDDYPEISQ